jgi:hypothetical protein
LESILGLSKSLKIWAQGAVSGIEARLEKLFTTQATVSAEYNILQ